MKCSVPGEISRKVISDPLSNTMKMAEETASLTFRANGDGVSTDPIASEEVEKIADSDITIVASTNKQGDEPTAAASLDSMDLLSQEAAVEEFLAGDPKGEEFSEEMLMSNIGNEEDAVDFKQDNELEGCEQLAQNVFQDCSVSNKEVIRELKRRAASYNKRPHWWLLKSLKKRSIK